ncbi:MAG: FKBP-type peptidyl-prolyl cis-trans isomerase [Planctomycetota bacterium]
MKRNLWTAVCLFAVASMSFAQEPKAPEKTPEAKEVVLDPAAVKERSSYAIGLNIGRNLKREGIELDIKIFAEGLAAGLEGQKPRFTDEELAGALEALEKQMTAKIASKRKMEAETNAKTGANFLAENKTKEGVKTLASGLQYEVVKAGTGKKNPKSSDKVQTHYRGRLIDGTEFDSSYERGEPATFPVDGVIKGWTEALQLMKEGDSWRLYVPAELAYGERGAPPAIGPNQVLIFDIELLKIGE